MKYLMYLKCKGIKKNKALSARTSQDIFLIKGILTSLKNNSQREITSESLALKIINVFS